MLATSMNYLGTGRRNYQMYGMNYGVRLDQAAPVNVEQARKTLTEYKKLVRDRGWRDWADRDQSEIVVGVEGDELSDPTIPWVLLTTEEAGNLNAAVDILAADIMRKTGVSRVTLAQAGAQPSADAGQTVDQFVRAATKLRELHTEATGAAEFPTATVLLTIAGVAVIGGLTVWGVARRGRGPKRRGRRRRRR